MSRLKRYYGYGNHYFITAVTHRRNKILINASNLLLDSLLKFKEEIKYNIISYIILPDHFHILIDAPEHNLSNIMQKIKLSFSKKLRMRNKRMDGIIWQKRFWDHVIRNQNDLNRHIDYIHYNPVKHGLTDNPFDWKYSSIHDFFAEGYYSLDWGVKENINMSGEYGEWNK